MNFTNHLINHINYKTLPLKKYNHPKYLCKLHRLNLFLLLLPKKYLLIYTKLKGNMNKTDNIKIHKVKITNKINQIYKTKPIKYQYSIKIIHQPIIKNIKNKSLLYPILFKIKINNIQVLI